MSKICAYSGNYYPDVFKLHADEMREWGFDTIVLCVPEEALYYNLANIGNMVEYAVSRGMAVWADPWGVARLFDGEAFSGLRDKPACITRMPTQSLLYRWCKDIESLAFDAVFFDNPKPKCYCCTTKQIVQWVTELSTLPKVVCLSAIENKDNPEIYEEVAALPGVVEIGCDPYCLGNFENFNYAYVRQMSKVVLTAARNQGKLAHVWVQGFNVPDKYFPGSCANIARSTGVERIGFWSFRACEAISSLRNSNYQEIWQQIHRNL